MQNRFLLAGVVLLFAITSAHASVISINTYSTYEAVNNGSVTSGAGSNPYYDRLGTRTTGASGTLVSMDIPIVLPTIPAGQMITDATLSVTTIAQSSNKPTASADLYGVNTYTATAPNSSNEPYYYSGTPADTNTGVTLLQAAFMDKTNGTTNYNFTSNDFSTFIKGLYTAGAVPGNYVTFRLSYDGTSVSSANRYEVFTSGSISGFPSAAAATLTITTSPTPEPASMSLLGLATYGLFARRRST